MTYNHHAARIEVHLHEAVRHAHAAYEGDRHLAAQWMLTELCAALGLPEAICYGMVDAIEAHLHCHAEPTGEPAWVEPPMRWQAVPTGSVHQPYDAACVGHLAGQPVSDEAHCPICSPEASAAAEAVNAGKYGRCEVVDDGGDAHFSPHPCRSPLRADGTCPWHGVRVR